MYVMVYVWVHLFHSDRSEILAGRRLWKRDSHISLGIVSDIFLYQYNYILGLQQTL